MASVTKSFTAMSVALLVDEGKLEWDKPVREYMPEFILDDAYVSQHITVRDMLSHRTGLPRHDLSAWRLDLPRTEYVKRLKHFKFSATFRRSSNTTT
jgi:CubicO group peptidase (beta-lactamase class C family)